MQLKQVLFLGLLTACCGVLAAEDNPPLAIRPLGGPAYAILEGAGNVLAVADPDGVVLVDAMKAGEADRIRQLLQPLPGAGKVRLVVNTHWHNDHTDGNRAFGPEACIVAHEEVLRRVAQDTRLAFFDSTTRALPAGARPNITFTGGLDIHAGGQVLRLVHYPGAHTGGDTAVFLDALKIVHLGDMFFNGMYPFLDYEYGGDIDSWVRHLDAILAGLTPDWQIVPGHGPLARPADLRAFRDMLHDSAEAVRAGIRAGKTLAQIQADGLPERFAPWAKYYLSTPQWLELVYRNLRK